MKRFKELALAFALAVGASAPALAEQSGNPQSQDVYGVGNGMIFDANKVAYDVDTRTGQCFAVTFMNAGAPNGTMAMAAVDCDEVVLSFVPARKRMIYKSMHND